MFKTYELLTKDESDNLVTQLNSLDGWEEGKARTKELTGTVKQNLEISRNHPISKEASNMLSKRLYAVNEFQINHAPSKMLSVKFNKYTLNGTYQRHTDSSLMGDVRTDMACTIFLTDPDSYVGGELCIEMVDGEIIKHKGKQGHCVIYPCGRPHWVTPVTEGTRISGITWIQSYLRDPEHRQILAQIRKLNAEIELDVIHEDSDCKNRKIVTDIAAIDGALMRMWMD